MSLALYLGRKNLVVLLWHGWPEMIQAKIYLEDSRWGNRYKHNCGLTPSSWQLCSSLHANTNPITCGILFAAHQWVFMRGFGNRIYPPKIWEGYRMKNSEICKVVWMTMLTSPKYLFCEVKSHLHFHLPTIHHLFWPWNSLLPWLNFPSNANWSLFLEG